MPGPSLNREAGLGLKATIETIDNRGDFKTFMQNYAYARGSAIKGPRREGPPDEGFVRLSIHFIIAAPLTTV
jgi:hypothetical protein